MSDNYQPTHNQRAKKSDQIQELMNDQDLGENLEGYDYEQQEDQNNSHEYSTNNQYDIHQEYDSNDPKRSNYANYSKGQHNNYPPLHPNHPSNSNSFYSSLEKTVNINNNYQIRTPLANNSFRVSQKTKQNQDEVLTQGKSSKSIQEQLVQEQIPTNVKQRSRSQLRNQKNDSEITTEEKLIFDNNNLFFVVGEIYKKIQSDELFKTLKTDDTSREYLHYRVQEIIQDSYVKSLIHTLKEMQSQLNYQVDENIKFQEIIVMQEEKQQYQNDQLTSYQQKCNSLEEVLTDIQSKDEERNKEIRQLYIDRNNSEKALLEKYEVLQEQNSKLDKKNHELQVQLQQLNDKQHEIVGVKDNFQDQVVQNQVMKKDMEKLQLEIMQKEQEIQKLQTKMQEQSEKYQKETEEINIFYEKELKLMKTQRKKEKEMYEKIIQEKKNLDIISNTSQNSLVDQMSNQIQELQQKLVEIEEDNILMNQEYQNLQHRMSEQQEVHRNNIETIKLNHKGEINDMKKIQEKIEQINSDLQKDYSLLKQSKQMNETNLNDKHTLERQLLNDQIQKLQLDIQSTKLSKESLGKDIIEVTQMLEKERNENSKLHYKIQILSDRDSQDTNSFKRRIEDLEEGIKKQQKEYESLVQEKERYRAEAKEKDDMIRQKQTEHQEIIKRLSKAQQKFEEVERRTAEVQEEKNNLYRLLDSKGKEMKRLEDEIQQLQKKVLEKENQCIVSDASIQQLNQQIKLLVEQKDSKNQEIKNVSKEIRNVQKDMEMCRDMNIQNQHKLLQHEEEEKRLKEIEMQQKDIIIQLSSRIEQLEFELLHIREDFEHKENVFREHYESQIEKMHEQLSEGISRHMQAYANQSNSQLIQMLKDNQIEIQEQEQLVNKQYAEITHLKAMNEQLNRKLLELISMKKKNYSPSQYEAIVRENQYLKENNKSLRSENQDSMKKRFHEASISIQQQFSYNSIQSPRISDIDPSKKSSEVTSPRVDQSTLTLPRQGSSLSGTRDKQNNEDHLQIVIQKLESTQSHFIQVIQNLNKQHHLDSDDIKQQYSRMKNSQAQDKKTHSMLKQSFTQKLMDLRQILYGDIKDTLIDYRRELTSVREYADTYRVFNQEVTNHINKQLHYIEQIESKTDSSNNQSPNQDRSGDLQQLPASNNQYSKSNSNPRQSPTNQTYNHFKNNSMKQEKYLKQFSIEEENSSLSESNYQGSMGQQTDAKQQSVANQQLSQSSYQKKINF